MGDGSDGSGDPGLYCSLLSCFCVTIAIVLRILKDWAAGSSRSGLVGQSGAAVQIHMAW